MAVMTVMTVMDIFSMLTLNRKENSATLFMIGVPLNTTGVIQMPIGPYILSDKNNGN